MQYYYVQSTPQSSAPKAIAPLLWKAEDYTKVIPADSGDTPVDLFVGVAGSPAPLSGSVYKENPCDNIRLTISFITGDDCNPCTVDTANMSTQDEYFILSAGTIGMSLPNGGYIANIQAVVVDSAGAPIKTQTGNTLRFSSSRAASCAGNEVLIP